MGKRKLTGQDIVNLGCEGLKPRTQHAYVGIEIECIAPIAFDDMAEEIAASDIAPYVGLDDDCSLCPNSSVDGYSDNEDDHTFELKVLCKQSEVPVVLPKVCAFLKQRRAYVNDTCGLHVHLDMRGRDPEHAYRRLLRAERLLYRLQPRARTVGEYSYPVDDVDADLEHERTYGTHYSGISASALKKHGTLEVRMHEGTVDAETIVNWVALLLRIINCRRLKAPVDNVVRLAEVVRLPERTKRYVEQRTLIYAEEHDEAA